MEIFAAIIVILLLLVGAATIAALLRDGRGHTPRVESHEEWSALDLPSTSYTLRLLSNSRTAAGSRTGGAGPAAVDCLQP